MTDTPVLSLPLLAPAQAQKHVTVNEALAKIDGLAQLTLQSVTTTTPPVAVVEGDVYHVPPGAVNEWSGQDGRVAIGVNGGWEFVDPRRGWRGVVLDQGGGAVFDGSTWRVGGVTLSPNNAGAAIRCVEFDFDLTPGVVLSTPVVFPPRSIALGITGRVVGALTGSLTSWELGVAGEAARYGSGLGVAVDSWLNGPGNPIVYWSPTPLQLTATGGAFASGTVRLAAHFIELSLPDPV